MPRISRNLVSTGKKKMDLFVYVAEGESGLQGEAGGRKEQL